MGISWKTMIISWNRWRVGGIHDQSHLLSLLSSLHLSPTSSQRSPLQFSWKFGGILSSGTPPSVDPLENKCQMVATLSAFRRLVPLWPICLLPLSRNLGQWAKEPSREESHTWCPLGFYCCCRLTSRSLPIWHSPTLNSSYEGQKDVLGLDISVHEVINMHG